MLSMLPGLMRLASRLACLVVIASFVLFVVDQTSAASNNQRQELNSELPQEVRSTTTTSTNQKSEKHGAVREGIDEASETLTSPFSGVTAGNTNQWVIRGTNTVLALLVYGVGIGFAARTLSLRT